MKQISVDDLARWRREGKEFMLLDVREPHEVETASLSDAVTIPMREIPQRVNELSKDRTIAVICHHGGRSERVAQFLEIQNFSDVVNVDGGIDAYALQIDPSIPRY